MRSADCSSQPARDVGEHPRRNRARQSQLRLRRRRQRRLEAGSSGLGHGRAPGRGDGAADPRGLAHPPPARRSRWPRSAASRPGPARSRAAPSRSGTGQSPALQRLEREQVVKRSLGDVKRNLDQHDFVYLFLDAIYLKLHPDDTAAEGVLVAWGVTLEGVQPRYGGNENDVQRASRPILDLIRALSGILPRLREALDIQDESHACDPRDRESGACPMGDCQSCSSPEARPAASPLPARRCYSNLDSR